MQPLFGFTVLSLPNTGFFEITAANFGSPEEQEALARKRDSFARDSEYVETRFKDNEKTKADMVLIEATINLLKLFHLDGIEAILGKRQPIPENSLLPAAFHYGMLTVSAHQDAGESTGAFFPSATSEVSTSLSSQIERPSRRERSTSSAIIPIRWTIARVKPGKRRENSNDPRWRRSRRHWRKKWPRSPPNRTGRNHPIPGNNPPLTPHSCGVIVRHEIGHHS